MGVSEEIPAIDDEGYLVDPADWNENLSRVMARQENIELGDAHWVAIHFMRDFYQEHQVIPDVLFPYGYVKQACKIAGMKRPRGWSTG